MKVTTKQILITVAVVLVILIGVGFWFYRKGKKKTTIADVPVDQATGTNNPSGVSQTEIVIISDALFRDMDGFNWSGHDVAPYQNFNALSDTDFVKVYNAFNRSHQENSGETLKEWIESESFAFDDVIESILERMARLNLK